VTSRATRDDAAGRAYLDLRKLARADGRATDEYLRLYALEGFLARLASSVYREAFVVKGGVLPAAFGARRPTADIDLAAIATSNEVAEVRRLSLPLPYCRSMMGWYSTHRHRAPQHPGGGRVRRRPRWSDRPARHRPPCTPRRCQRRRSDLATARSRHRASTARRRHPPARLPHHDGASREACHRQSARRSQHEMARFRRHLLTDPSTSA
jgi:hypothetical protein